MGNGPNKTKMQDAHPSKKHEKIFCGLDHSASHPFNYSQCFLVNIYMYVYIYNVSILKDHLYDKNGHKFNASKTIWVAKQQTSSYDYEGVHG